MASEAKSRTLRACGVCLPRKAYGRSAGACRSGRHICLEALLSETSYDRDRAPLPAVRNAQRRAVQTGLGGQAAGEPRPTLTLEAWQTDEG